MSESKTVIDQLIINSPYYAPKEYWSYDSPSQTFSRQPGRRKAGYVIASQREKTFNDPGKFVEIPLVQEIRKRVDKWKEKGYPGTTPITKLLLSHWRRSDQFYRFFFCQLEAIETLIWIAEAPDSERTGINIPSDGGPFQRYCSKMATGTGKTVVMSMLAAWQILNKVASPRDARFSKNILIMAPGLTVKSRLGILDPQQPDNYFEEFSIVPNHLLPDLRQGKVEIKNWHSLSWDTEEQIKKKKSVDKRGPLSDEAYVRRALGSLARHKNLIIINDEAHHAWRSPAESKVKGVKKEEIEKATVWVDGLDRIHKARGILSCFDFSATPFSPSGKKASEEALFEWIVSDFGLNDAIESGLVKTPRIVVRDDGKIDPKTYRSKLYHIYDNEEVKTNLNRKSAKPEDPLPDLVVNAYHLLGHDWLETKNHWDKSPLRVPPVMISVVNKTETAARIKYAFDSKKIKIKELTEPDKTLHIDSTVLEKAESGEKMSNTEAGGDISRKLTKQEQAELLRKTVDTVGKVAEPGEQIRHVISVSMLTEGWDAKTVTHIMGLRAFSSQLLCEQVVGRGLRRISYEIDPETEMFSPEYVNVFGVPFSFLPFEGTGGASPKPPSPKIPIFPEGSRQQFRIDWPNILRIEHTLKSKIELDISKVPTLELNASEIVSVAELAPTIDGKPDMDKVKEIDIEKLAEKFRLQRMIFEAARDVYDQIEPGWAGDKGDLLGQLVVIVEKFIKSDWLKFNPPSYREDETKSKLLIALSSSKIVQHLFDSIRYQNIKSFTPIFDTRKPILSTDDAGTWYTGKPCEKFKKTHLNLCVFDSTWEKATALELDRSKHVKAWVKNDHLGFEIHYIFKGVVRKYIPDFIVELINGTKMVIEVKGQETEQDRTKWSYLNEWVQAVNADGRFGRWAWDVSADPAASDISKIIELALK